MGYVWYLITVVCYEEGINKPRKLFSFESSTTMALCDLSYQLLLYCIFLGLVAHMLWLHISVPFSTFPSSESSRMGPKNWSPVYGERSKVDIFLCFPISR